MVSFSCEVCNDTVKKNKLDQHAQRCRGAYYTCIDCSTTFNGTEYRSHTSCISEAEKYEKALYKGKGKADKSKEKKPDTEAVKGFTGSKGRESKKEKENVKENVKDAEKKEKKEKKNKNSPLADISKLSDGSLYKIVKSISKDSNLDKKKVMEKLQVKISDGKLVISL